MASLMIRGQNDPCVEFDESQGPESTATIKLVQFQILTAGKDAFTEFISKSAIRADVYGPSVGKNLHRKTTEG